MKLEMNVARKRAHMKQSEVAERMGVSAVMVHYWETGKCRISEDRLAEYCDIVGISPKNIFLPIALK